MITQTVGVERDLTLAAVFRNSGWEEGLIDVPKSDASIQAIYAELGRSWCGDTPAELEMRFQNQDDTLQIEVGQALNSANSDVTVEYRLTADGVLVDTEKVAFNQRAELSTNLTGISAITLQAQPSEGPNSGSCRTTAVVTSLKLVPA